MTRMTRSVTAAAGLLAACAVIAVTAVGVGAKGTGKATSGTVYAAITHTVGKTENAAGQVNDTVLGEGAVLFALTVGSGSKPGTVPLKGTLIAFTKTGELSGTDSVDLNVSATGTTFTNGKFKLTKGLGAQKGHSFIGTFTGTASSPTGPYVFHDKVIYK